MKINPRHFSVAAKYFVFCAFLFLEFAKCATLEPFTFLHAPWRQECKKEVPCWDRFCAPKVVWKSKQDLDVEENLGSYKNRAVRGDDEAAIALGIYYEQGILTVADRGESIKWYRVAAERGNTEAELRMGDLESAQEWYLRAAAKGNGEAISRMVGANGSDGETPSYWRYIDDCVCAFKQPNGEEATIESLVNSCNSSGLKVTPWSGATQKQIEDVRTRANIWMAHLKVVPECHRGPAIQF